MSTVSREITWGTQPRCMLEQGADRWRRYAQQRLSQVCEAAPTIELDDTSRFVFASDCHRGDNGRADAFAVNEGLFLDALGHYESRGFTYVEVGDGDELWQNRRLEVVRRAHARTYDLLHRLHAQGRLHLILGNHDIPAGRPSQMSKDGLVAREGLILRHARTGQRILVVHGHQADFRSDRLAVLSRFTVRTVWRRMLLLGLARGTLWTDDLSRRSFLEQRVIARIQARKLRIERWIAGWADARQQMVICGHTHRAASAQRGMPPYFNTGSCVVPGQITALEIQGGAISLVLWRVQSGHVRRESMSRPVNLRAFA